MSLIGDGQVISLQRTKVCVFSESVLCFGKAHENAQSNTAWEQRLELFKSSPECRTLVRIDGDPMEFEWNIFPGFTTLQSGKKFKSCRGDHNETSKNFAGRIIFMGINRQME